MSLMIGGHSWWGPGGGGGSAGKSAVQLLQESKSQYVKSDLVLGSSQRPARPDRFHISSNPNIFLNAPAHTLHATRLSPDPLRRLPAPEEPKASSPPRTVATLTPSALAEHTNATSKSFSAAPVRIQRGAPRPRAKTQPIGDPFLRGGDLRRSLSHGHADRGSTGGDDIQMKLRKLLDVGSKEKLCQESLFSEQKVSSEPKDDANCGTGTFRAEPAKVTVHKSLPDLWRTSISSEESESDKDGASPDKRRPSCPSVISTKKEAITNCKFKTKTTAQPPPIPPRRFRDITRPLPKPPEVPKRPTVRISPPKIPPRNRNRPLHSADIQSDAAVPLVPEAGRRSSDSDASAAGGSDDLRRRPILRSKSDITHERCAFGVKDVEVDGSPCASLSGEDLESFFESMGMDEETFKEVMESPEETMTEYFDEKSSEDSIPRRCSSEEDGQAQQAALRPGEPSIIEKNARIIKWLFTCQKAQGCLAQRPTTKSS